MDGEDKMLVLPYLEELKFMHLCYYYYIVDVLFIRWNAYMNMDSFMFANWNAYKNMWCTQIVLSGWPNKKLRGLWPR
jgi:hypothetical protein